MRISRPRAASPAVCASGSTIVSPWTRYATNASGAGAYPISSFTWLLVQKDAKDATKAKIVKDFLTWMISPDAQKMATELNYAPLPAEVVSLIQARLPTLKAGGKSLASN